MPFQAVATQRLYQQVAEQIAALIHGGELPAGGRLPPERDLSKRLGVSRPTVREAMIALEISGLVEVRTGSGIYVKARADNGRSSLDAGPSAFELLSARRIVESEIAACAAEHASADDVEALNHALAAHRTEIMAGRDGFEADRNYHLQLARTTGNTVLVQIVTGFWNDMRGPIFNRLTELSSLPIKDRSNFSHHERIRDAVARHDPVSARRAMQDHLAHVEAFFMDEVGADHATIPARDHSARA